VERGSVDFFFFFENERKMRTVHWKIICGFKRKIYDIPDSTSLFDVMFTSGRRIFNCIVFSNVFLDVF